MKSFKFSKTSQTDDFKNSVYEFTALKDEVVLPKRSLQIRRKRDKTISNYAQTPFCFEHCVSEINTISDTSLNHDDRRMVFKSEPLLENTFFFAKATSIKSNISIAENSVELVKFCHQEMKNSENQNISLPLIQSLEKINISNDFIQNVSETFEIEKSNISNDFIQDVSETFEIDKSNISNDFIQNVSESFKIEKTNISNDFIQNVSESFEIEKTVETSSICVNKFKTGAPTGKTLTPRKSICTNDAIYELIRQQRMSWWSDDVTPTFKSMLNQDNFCISRVRHSYKIETKLQSVSCNYKHGRKCRVRKVEYWRTVALPSDSKSSSDSDSEKVFMKPKEKKKILLRKKFSDESELDDSGSSLDGSFRRHSSDSSDSCSESTEYSSTNCNHSAPPASSRIFEDSPAEFETMFQKKKENQFWNPALVKHLDKNFTENLGFASVLLQALQCLCQYEDKNFETSLY